MDPFTPETTKTINQQKKMRQISKKRKGKRKRKKKVTWQPIVHGSEPFENVSTKKKMRSLKFDKKIVLCFFG